MMKKSQSVMDASKSLYTPYKDPNASAIGLVSDGKRPSKSMYEK